MLTSTCTDAGMGTVCTPCDGSCRMDMTFSTDLYMSMTDFSAANATLYLDAIRDSMKVPLKYTSIVSQTPAFIPSALKIALTNGLTTKVADTDLDDSADEGGGFLRCNRPGQVLVGGCQRSHHSCRQHIHPVGRRSHLVAPRVVQAPRRVRPGRLLHPGVGRSRRQSHGVLR